MPLSVVEGEEFLKILEAQPLSQHTGTTNWHTHRLTTEVPVQHFAQHYNDIHQPTAWRCRAHLRGACTRQGVWPLPHVRAWPLLSVHAAVGAAHPAFTQQSTSPVPKQGTLAAVGAHEAWIACLAACEEIDKNTPQSGRRLSPGRRLATSRSPSSALLDGSTCALMGSTTRRWCRRCS